MRAPLEHRNEIGSHPALIARRTDTLLHSLDTILDATHRDALVLDAVWHESSTLSA